METDGDLIHWQDREFPLISDVGEERRPRHADPPPVSIDALVADAIWAGRVPDLAKHLAVQAPEPGPQAAHADPRTWQKS
jgi:hypothetical protein